mmetsp:Transcript_23391/g.50654  ORF Transcript_23391/g.50654 Transcript_23391/m.50654 type:complete len:538 (+) Transcript_23391:61-1674(+)
MAALNNNGMQPTGSIPGPIPSAISVALESNIALQAELRRRLLKIKGKQVQNRRDAARVAASISRCWNDGESLVKGPLSGSSKSTGEPPSKKLRIDSAHNLSEACASSGGDEKTAPIEIDGKETLRKNNDSDPMSTESVLEAPKAVSQSSKSSKPKWACIPNRKVTRGFFVDPDGSTPEILWTDIGLENEIETEMQSPRVIFERNETQLPCEEPQKTWEKVKKKNWPTTSIDEIALRIDRTSPKSAEECRVACFTFADSKIVKTKFTKQECLFIMSMMSRLGGGAQKDIDWYEMAMKHYAKFNRQSPWLCFSHYRSSLQNPSTRCPAWSPDEDELLLKYLAVHGSQYLLQGDSIMQTSRNLFPLRSAKQVALRAQTTLINPNYIHDAWDPDEKRKLALLMRAYSNEQNPINCVARIGHFPHRASKSVLEKWIKTLDPSLSYRPFTTDEDVKLHEISGETISRKIPHRSGDFLKKRWTELADEHTVATHCENKLIRKAFAKGGFIGSGGDSLLSPDDFMVLPQSKVSRRQLSKQPKSKR